MGAGSIVLTRAAVFSGLITTTTALLLAQQSDSSQAQAFVVADEKAAVAPTGEPAKSKRAQQPPALTRNPDLDPAEELARPAKPPSDAKPGRLVVACRGAFAKDSNHLKLAMTYDTKNVEFSEVDAGAGKTMASIIYPKEPKHRLEIWWSNVDKRKDTYLIAINSASTWTGPHGLRLGLSLADLEKLNRKPFKLRGFDKDKVAAVTDWDGGTFAALPGGCKAGVLLRAEAKAAIEVIAALPGDHEFSSTDPALRATRPAVTEILIGY
jgi:hypothetical protein